MDSLNEAFAADGDFAGMFPNLGANDIAALFELYPGAGLALNPHHPAAADLGLVPLHPAAAASDLGLVPLHPAAAGADLGLVPLHPAAAADLGLLPLHPAAAGANLGLIPLQPAAAADLGLIPHQHVHGNQEAAHDDLLPDEEVDIEPNPNPWKLVRSCKYGRMKRNVPEVYPPTPQVRVAEVEVEWVPKTGSLRSIRKHSQGRKSGYLSTAEGPGFYTYPCYVPMAGY